MAYDEVLADQIREVLAGEPGVSERKMFGGLAFLVDGHMAVAAATKGLMMVRTDPADTAELLDGDSVEQVEMGGRFMKGWLYVAIERFRDEAELREWVTRSLTFVRTLPPKTK